jgi:hypothetical protein
VPKGASIAPRRRVEPGKLRLIVRLEVEALHVQGSRCTVTVVNSGTVASFGTRINVYRRPLLGNPIGGVPALQLAGSATTSVGALERKDVGVGLPPLIQPLFSRLYAVAFDPLQDPFPVSRIDELTWQERDLLRHDLGAWQQLAHVDTGDYFGDNDLVGIPDGQRSWTLGISADHAAGLPAGGPGPDRVYFPGEPPRLSSDRTGARSEFRQVIDLMDLPNGALAVQEASKGNLVASAACETVSSPDRGAVAVALGDTRAGVMSAVAQAPSRPVAQAHAGWTHLAASVGRNIRFDHVTVRLLAERRAGQDSDSCFGNVTCTLQHRQVKATGVLLSPPVGP